MDLPYLEWLLREPVPDPEMVVYDALPYDAARVRQEMLKLEETARRRQSLSIDLEGALAGVLALAANDKRPLASAASRVR
jgi:hypothetical protein